MFAPNGEALFASRYLENEAAFGAHYEDEERSICAEYKTQVQNYFLVSPDTLINACLWAC